jgi:hypothetical protein
MRDVRMWFMGKVLEFHKSVLFVWTIGSFGEDSRGALAEIRRFFYHKSYLNLQGQYGTGSLLHVEGL